MSDFEDKLRSFELRQPLPGWQGEIAAECTFTKLDSPLRSWFWPSPLAWAALAIIWLGLAVANHQDLPRPDHARPSESRSLSSVAFQTQDIDSLWPLAANSPQ
jgi:hypothetical protein